MIYDKSVVMMSKNPITDPGKKSKEGLLTVECNDGVFSTIAAETMEAYEANQAKLIHKIYYEEQGLLTSFDSLKEMRERTTKDETHWIGPGKVVVVDNERKRKWIMPDSL